MGRTLAAEFKKLIRLGHIPLIFLLALSSRLVLCLLPSSHHHAYSTEVYKQYTTQLEGILTDEKADYLNDCRDDFLQIISEPDEMQRKYESGEIDLDAYSAFTAHYDKAKAELGTIEYLCGKCERLGELTGFEKQLFYDTDWSDFFGDNGYDYVMLLALLCIAVPAFDMEFSSGSYAPLLTSKRGKTQLAFAKLIVVLSAVILLSLMMGTVRLTTFAWQHGLDFSGKAAGNLLVTDSLGDTTLLGYFITDACLKALAFAMYAVTACLVSTVCKNVTFSFALSFLICVTPLFILTEPHSSYLLSASVLKDMYSGISAAAFALLTCLKISAVSLVTAVLWERKRK